MKLFLISQNINNHYDTYDSAVVSALDEDAARNTHPSEYNTLTAKDGYWYLNGEIWNKSYGDWVHPKDVTVKYIGETEEKAGVICSSFNAG